MSRLTREVTAQRKETIMIITFNKEKNGISRILLEEHSGDTMKIEFRAVKHDPVLPDSIWKITE